MVNKHQTALVPARRAAAGNDPIAVQCHPTSKTSAGQAVRTHPWATYLNVWFLAGRGTLRTIYRALPFFGSVSRNNRSNQRRQSSVRLDSYQEVGEQRSLRLTRCCSVLIRRVSRGSLSLETSMRIVESRRWRRLRDRPNLPGALDGFRSRTLEGRHDQQWRCH